MDARAARLKLKLRGAVSDEDVAELVKAGFGTPRRIKEATDDELKRVKGIGQGKLGKLRARYPHRER